MTNRPELSTEFLIERSALFHRAAAQHVQGLVAKDGGHAMLAHSMAVVAMEHAGGICALLTAGSVTSAVTLLRIQFETVVRAMWIYYSASDEWLQQALNCLDDNAGREPADSPAIARMLDALDREGPPACQVLRRLKMTAWSADEAYVHGSIHAVAQLLRGYSSSCVTRLLQDANALFAVAATFAAVVADDREAAQRLKDVQARHQDCLPPD